MLVVAACKLCDPVVLVVLVISHDGLAHEGCLWRLTFELSRPTPDRRLAREVDDGPHRLAGQVPSRWRSARAKG